ncbi:Conserved_hypothetical protein [Hexamita inflata]|uniref:Transmembrane protein n=1 Tax=Hexamita inflata TaxID=28002 RepID=A0AA86NG79_9EUKA|nr:Conserved hypothetical protein [Hexamita inflata]
MFNIFIVLQEIQTYITDIGGIGVLYQPQLTSVVFKYSIPITTQQYTIQTQIDLQIVLESYQSAEIVDEQPIALNAEDIFNISQPCQLFKESRPYVCTDQQSYSQVRVLSTVKNATYFSLVNQVTKAWATIIMDITNSEGTTQQILKIESGQKLQQLGYTIYFYQIPSQTFKNLSIITYDDLQSAFYFPYLNVQNGCNNIPTNIMTWKRNIGREINATLNKYVTIPSPFSDCTDATPNTEQLSKYDKDLVFANTVENVSNTISMKQDLHQPTVQIEFTSDFVQFIKPQTDVDISVKLMFDQQQHYLQVKLVASTPMITTQKQLVCDFGTFIISSAFINTELTQQFTVLNSSGNCYLDGKYIKLDKSETLWAAGQWYTAVCDPAIHITIIDQCFSGCANDSVYSNNECVPLSCSIYPNNARPNYYILEHRCVTNAELQFLNIELNPQMPFENQYVNLTVVCVNGVKTIGSPVPCICVEGNKMQNVTNDVIYMCLKNTEYAEPMTEVISITDVVNDISQQVQEVFNEVFSEIKGFLKGLFGKQWITIVVVIIVVIVLIFVTPTLYKMTIKCIRQNKGQRNNGKRQARNIVNSSSLLS